MESDYWLEGALDLHVHSSPDVKTRALTDLELARHCHDQGMAGALIKSHSEPTAGRALIANSVAPSMQLYGGLVLNSTVGGINPYAVEHLAKIEGAKGKIVWLPTQDARNDRETKGKAGPIVEVTHEGIPLRALDDIFDLVRENDLVLATGHVSPSEGIAIFKRAQQSGCTRLLVTHVTAGVTRYHSHQLVQMLELGAKLEICVRNLYTASANGQMKIMRRKVDYSARIFQISDASPIILSSDLGDDRYPLPHAGLSEAANALACSGLDPELIRHALTVAPHELVS